MFVGSAILTSKGQITLPAELRRHFGLREGDAVEFYLRRKGDLFIRPRNATPQLFLDSLPPRPRQASDHEAIAAAVGERNARSRSLSDAAE